MRRSTHPKPTQNPCRRQEPSPGAGRAKFGHRNWCWRLPDGIHVTGANRGAERASAGAVVANSRSGGEVRWCGGAERDLRPGARGAGPGAGAAGGRSGRRRRRKGCSGGVQGAGGGACARAG
jgi:hypothetical protein